MNRLVSLVLCSLASPTFLVACAGHPQAPTGPSAAPRQTPSSPTKVETIPSNASTKEQASKDADLSAAADSYVSAMERLAVYFETQKEDCAALAITLRDAAEARAHLLAASTGPAHHRANTVPELRIRLAAATHTIADVSMKCASNPKFANVQMQSSQSRPAANPGPRESQ